MTYAQTKLLSRLDAPSVAPASVISQINGYRPAIRAAWQNRRVANMTRATLCEITGMRASHVADYLNDKDVDERGRDLRDMPAKYLPAFETAVGNSFASQWLAMQSQLTILEAQIAEQKAHL